MKHTKKETTTKYLVPMIILFIALVLGAGSVAAASADNTSNSTNITTATENSQLNETQTNTINSNPADPQIWRDGAPVARGSHPAGYQYSTIAEAINDALDGDTIMLESGAVFHEQLTVGKSLTFNVLDNGQATLNGSTFSDSILTINSGVTVYLYNLIFTDGNAGFSGGAILNRGTLNAENCTFTHNTGGFEGGAICNLQGTFTLNNCAFYRNQATVGGAIVSVFNPNLCSVTNCTFIDNNAADGGAFNNNGGSTTTITDCNFTGNQASVGGAIINWGVLTLTGSNLEGNTANYYGGAISVWNSGITTNLHFNRIVGNTAPDGNAIYCRSSTVNATNNWWGNNTPDFNSLFTLAFDGVVNADPWMILRVTTNPGTINNSENSQVTVDLLHDSTYDPANPEASYHDPSLGHVPDGQPILLNLSWGSFTDPVVTHSLTNYTLNGTVTAIFYANEGRAPTDPVTVNATLDSYLAAGSIDVDPVSNLAITLNGPTTVSAGKTIIYTITVTNSGLDDAENVLLTDILPPGLSNVRWTAVYSGGASGPASGTGDLNLNLGTFPANGMVTITVTADVPSSTVEGTVLTNTATITSTTGTTPDATATTMVTGSGENSDPATVNAASEKTIRMQTTGVPIAGIVLSILMVLGGFIGAQKRN